MFYQPFSYPHPLRISGPLADRIAPKLRRIGSRICVAGESLEIVIEADGDQSETLRFGASGE